MEAQEKAKRLRNMFAQIAPMGLESLSVPRVTSSALEGLDTGSPAAVAESGLQKLRENRLDQLTNREAFALEAIVLPENRPAVFVREESYDDLPVFWAALNEAGVKARIASLFPLIGRVELPLNSLVPYGGTGFVVGKNLLMTNRHVAELFSRGLGLTIRYQPGGSAVNFRQQIDSPKDDHSAYLAVRGVRMIHPFWDMALLEVDNLPTQNALKLSLKSPEELLGANVVVVGYPAKDYRNDLDLQDQIFQKIYNVKRLQPGTVRAPAKVQSFENVVNALTHDASTLGGNSGSAVICVDSGEVVALHFAGEYLKANYAVPMYQLARDKRVAPLLNFDGSLTPTTEWESVWLSTGGTEGSLAPKSPPSVNVPSPPLQSPAIASPPNGGQSATWNIPVQITVTLGQPIVSRLPQASETRPLEEEGVVVDQDYSDRQGYDPAFLGDITVPLPTLTNNMTSVTSTVDAGSRPHGDPFELAYYHYSVYMNKQRRTAWFSAANVDGGHRPDIGKRQGDRWYTDTRIPSADQLGQVAFEPGIDRGHLTRREDTAWGKDVRIATAANNDTFHFTNCSLQASAFNRGKDRWQGLEQFLLEKHAKQSKQKMIVITGPLFAPNDPTYKNDKMNYSVRCPLQFWKVCVLIRENDTPSATAFILGQEEISDLPGFEEAFNVSATQISIADLEDKSGLRFGDLRAHDHFAAGGAPGTLETIPGTTDATKGGRVIRSFADIVV